MDIKHYRVLNVLLNTNTVDRYTFCVIDISKDIDTNKVYRAIIPKGMLKENILIAEVKKLTQQLYSKTSRKPDYVISTKKDFLKTSYQYEIYNRSDEHELGTHYIENFEVLKNKVTSLQQVKNQEGLFLTDGDSTKARWKFDHTQLRMPTFAFMFSLDLVLKNKTDALIKSLEQE